MYNNLKSTREVKNNNLSFDYEDITIATVDTHAHPSTNYHLRDTFGRHLPFNKSRPISGYGPVNFAQLTTLIHVNICTVVQLCYNQSHIWYSALSNK